MFVHLCLGEVSVLSGCWWPRREPEPPLGSRSVFGRLVYKFIFLAPTSAFEARLADLAAKRVLRLALIELLILLFLKSSEAMHYSTAYFRILTLVIHYKNIAVYSDHFPGILHIILNNILQIDYAFLRRDSPALGFAR